MIHIPSSSWIAAVILSLLILLMLNTSPRTLALAEDDLASWCKLYTPYPQECQTYGAQLLKGRPKPKPADFFKLAMQSAMVTATTATKNAYSLGPKSCRELDSDEPCREKAAWADCVELYDLALHHLNKTSTQLDLEHPTTCSRQEDAQTWISSALTYHETCREGFKDLSLTTSPILQPLVANGDHVLLRRLISNALQAINIIINKELDMTMTMMINNNGSSSRPPAGRYNNEYIYGSSSRSRSGNIPRDDQHQYVPAAGRWPSWLRPGDRKLLQSGLLATWVNLVVAKDGSGNYKTVSEAIAAAAAGSRPSGSTGRFVIHVKAGIYEENVVIGKDVENIMLLGDGIGNTIITGSRSVGGGSTTFSSATVGVLGDGFIAQGITFRNTAGPLNHQAVALRSGSDLSVLYQCSFEGYQDTLYVYSNRQFYRDCNIYGTVDFIFGNAAVVLQNCNIFVHFPPAGTSTLTAQGRTDPNQNTGIVIQGCRVAPALDLAIKSSGVNTFLGRPWKKYSRTVYMESVLHSLINPAGWMPWNGNFALDTLYYAEYQNTGPGSSTANRVKWKGYHVIQSAAVASQFTVANFIAGGSWLPAIKVPFNGGL
ncbi:hypothetical protein Dimus_006831 [Dionaea muscipula]